MTPDAVEKALRSTQTAPYLHPACADNWPRHRARERKRRRVRSSLRRRPKPNTDTGLDRT